MPANKVRSKKKTKKTTNQDQDKKFVSSKKPKFMPTKKRIILISVIIFIFSTLITMKIEAPFDGSNTIGYPFTFYIEHSGRCNPCPENMTEMNFEWLLIDFSIFGVFSWGVTNLYYRRRKKIHK